MGTKGLGIKQILLSEVQAGGLLGSSPGSSQEPDLSRSTLYASSVQCPCQTGTHRTAPHRSPLFAYHTHSLKDFINGQKRCPLKISYLALHQAKSHTILRPKEITSFAAYENDLY